MHSRPRTVRLLAVEHQTCMSTIDLHLPGEIDCNLGQDVVLVS